MKIIIDGTVHGTRVLNDAGEEIIGVRALTIRHNAGGLPELELELLDVIVQGVGLVARYYVPGVGFIRAVELENGERVELPITMGEAAYE